ncbi:metal ABC transporter substrate-binding protein [Treponema primitia]|uniref:metal ABC transporter substrate-binding protein n=1 Tax=Treponema primitia TaxID=88058 RepID=UPI003980A8B3
MKKQITFSILILFIVLVWSGCEKEKPAVSTADTGITVTAATFPGFDFARVIAGDRINLTMLLPPGAESHSYEPTPQDIIKIQNSDVFIYTGGESDYWLGEIIGSVDNGSMRILSLMDMVDVVEEEIVEGMEDEEEEDSFPEEPVSPEYDEHVWTSPRNVKRIIGAIAACLEEADPVNAGLYRENAAAYLVKLDELDAAFRGVVDQGRRKTIVFGDRFPFRYFADAYGLSYYAAFPGCSTETEPSAATVAFLINKIRAEKIPVVFHIELSNERMADTIGEATGAKKLLLHAGHNISKKDFEAGLSYLDLMKGNVLNLKEALQ